MPTSSSSEALGERILQLRRRRDLSQADLASRVGSTPTQISKYERGAYEPKAELLARLAEALGTSTDFLITGREPDSGLEALRPRLERLPAELRLGLVEFLDRLLHAHDLTSPSNQRR
jgi:transcriptional regulator with XRE-family HTH domain